MSSRCRTAATQERRLLRRELLVAQHPLVAQPREALELARRSARAPHGTADAGAASEPRQAAIEATATTMTMDPAAARTFVIPLAQAPIVVQL